MKHKDENNFFFLALAVHVYKGVVYILLVFLLHASLSSQ